MISKILESIGELVSNCIEAILKNPKIIITTVIGLIVISPLAINLLVTGEILKASGHEITGSTITGFVTWFGNVTTKIGMALLEPALWLFFAVVLGLTIYNEIKKIILSSFFLSCFLCVSEVV